MPRNFEIRHIVALHVVLLYMCDYYYYYYYYYFFGSRGIWKKLLLLLLFLFCQKWSELVFLMRQCSVVNGGTVTEELFITLHLIYVIQPVFGFVGSAFCRSKSQYGWLSVSRRAILRVLFLPLYHQW